MSVMESERSVEIESFVQQHRRNLVQMASRTLPHLTQSATVREGLRAAVTRELILLWVEWCKGSPHSPPRTTPGALHTDSGGIRLIYQEQNQYGEALNTGNTRHLAQLIGSRTSNPTILLNGDGFDIQAATDIQTMLRETVRQVVDPNKVMLIPWQALTAARLDFQSLRPIHVSEDREETVRHAVPAHPTWNRLEWENNPNARQTDGNTWEVNVEGVRYRITVATDDRVNYSWVWAATLEGGGPYGWQLLETVASVPAEAWEDWGFREQPSPGQMFWTEQRHMLGATVFSATSVDGGRRHRWISAFDQLERTPLYFLAQLPDKGKCESYHDALELLMPEIVKEARAEGRLVDRQGDIFFIETPFDDEAVYSRTKYRVRRSVALFDLEQNLPHIISGALEEPKPAEGEVTEEIDCPCGCGHKRTVGCGPSARQYLSIYRTGHTADEVAVASSGTTFVKGTVYHDPFLEDPARTRGDHAARIIGGDRGTNVWFLAVRNTVPRQDTRRTVVDDTLVDSYLTGSAAHRRRRLERRQLEAELARQAQQQQEQEAAQEEPALTPA